MRLTLKIDTDKLEDALNKTPDIVLHEMAEALDDIKDEWKTKAVNIAPKDTGNLRRQIDGEVETQRTKTIVTMYGNARQGDFNYGYYIHEVPIFGGREMTTPNTVEKFLEESADEKQWSKDLEDALERAIRKAGW